jgi:hypothetical protein
MSNRELLLQEIANTPDELLTDVLNFVQTIKATSETSSDYNYTALLNRIDYLEAIVGIRKGLEEFDRDEGIPAETALAQLQQKFNIPPES